ncbi:MAG: hypothetical protein FJ395_13090 [Verrucomicrobia bacterium]|nr:hypothetical protein [Verrucomicrobiota bacterium]
MKSYAEIERLLVERLRSLLSDVEGVGQPKIESVRKAMDEGFDIMAKISMPNGKQAVLCVECKAEPRPSLFEVRAAKELPKSVIPVLAAPVVSPRMAELCRRHGWSWYDLAGNCQLRVPGGIHIERTGFAAVHRRPPPRANLSTPHAARVIRALLALENFGQHWTQLSLMHHIGSVPPQAPVSIGLVNKVIRHLKDEAFFEDLPDGEFQLRDPLSLLAAWRNAYRFDRHERRAYFSLLQGKKLQAALARLDSDAGGFALYAAFSAAEFQAPHVRQPKTWLYVRAQELPKFEEDAEAKRVDSGENLVVLIPDDDHIFYLPDGGKSGEPRLGCTNLVQTYVDLCHCGGRSEEAAEALLEQRLKPEWRLRGVKV